MNFFALIDSTRRDNTLDGYGRDHTVFATKFHALSV